MAAGLFLIAAVSVAATAQSTAVKAVQLPFGEWLADVRARQSERGERQEVGDEELGDVTEPIARIIERDRAQVETVQPLETYISRRLRPAAIRMGRQMLIRHRALLGRVSDAYGVPAPLIVAIWGIETNYG